MKNKDFFGRKLYNFKESYTNLYYCVRSIPKFKKYMKKNVLTQSFKSKIMLATTEVNGCAMCSYKHTEIALESGVDQKEIQSLLNSVMSDIPEEERVAILFAQYYADNRGVISDSSWNEVVSEYGEEKALAILAAIQIIMAGNTYGIPMGSLLSRINKSGKYELDERSSLSYEILMILSLIIYLPVSIVHSIIASITSAPIAKFQKKLAYTS
ncbi:alkylhydroperoxidase AhpD family core domain-containing protein [Anaerosphaera aminiphila DSM 21120]|uniref:Alkylhydroperoxidase AhpD family core domain-containing protein n=1 Tax=Anaerosphaera aminiphila DSM 21120 TaxID=1120995 RepID=A0A1M5QUG8_9FIRM|nr:carboxymuconolactone decarboxylase family protein [Anaerosphaera aminiphila]SHH17807.1 alkylhydroperoxidase AhpD family core domain-containing protein [Anaerosphaera aminiphila DSM 21120]